MYLWIIYSNSEKFKSLLLLWIDIWYIYLLFPEQIFQQLIQLEVNLLRIYGNDSACIWLKVQVLFIVEITVPSSVI